MKQLNIDPTESRFKAWRLWQHDSFLQSLFLTNHVTKSKRSTNFAQLNSTNLFWKGSIPLTLALKGSPSLFTGVSAKNNILY